MLKNIQRMFAFAYFMFAAPIYPVFSQSSPTVPFSYKNGISKPSTLATHPFGILFYTLPHNFQFSPNNGPILNLHVSSGNIWGQPVTVYLPELPSIQNQMQSIPFYSRTFDFDPLESDSKMYFLQYDGVLKDFRISYSIPIANHYDLNLTARAFQLTNGKFPFTSLTGDQFIEFFHSNIAGGEDPFGRRALGMDRAQITYIDRNGRIMQIHSGQFGFSGIEAAFYAYPNVPRQLGVFLNLGVHLGLNLSPYNTSVDLGGSVAGVKNLRINHKDQLLFGLGINLLRKRMWHLDQEQVDLGTSSFISSFEGHLEYAIRSRGGAYHSLGLNYRIQTPYNNKREEDFYVPHNPDRIARWHEAARHLYKFPSYWSLIYSFTKKLEISVYLQQDMLVNNAPDIQTGLHTKIPFSF